MIRWLISHVVCWLGKHTDLI